MLHISCINVSVWHIVGFPIMDPKPKYFHQYTGLLDTIHALMCLMHKCSMMFQVLLMDLLSGVVSCCFVLCLLYHIILCWLCNVFCNVWCCSVLCCVVWLFCVVECSDLPCRVVFGASRNVIFGFDVWWCFVVVLSVCCAVLCCAVVLYQCRGMGGSAAPAALREHLAVYSL